MQQLQKLFNYHGQELRAIIKDEKPWFVASDVCRVLEIDTSLSVNGRTRLDNHGNPYQSGGLDYDEKDTDTVSTPSGKQEVLIVSEPGLYSLIMKSRKPEAKSFKRWVTHEVLPSIRKHGSYMTDETLEKALTNPDFLIQLATKLKDEQQARIAAETQLEEQKPLVSFAETCMTSPKSLLVREVAKLATKNGVVTGEKRLYQKLRDWGLVIKGRTEPTQRGMDAGYFEIKKGAYQHPEGARTFETTKVTPRGQMYIINRLKKEQDEIQQAN